VQRPVRCPISYNNVLSGGAGINTILGDVSPPHPFTGSELRQGCVVYGSAQGRRNHGTVTRNAITGLFFMVSLKRRSSIHNFRKIRQRWM